MPLASTFPCGFKGGVSLPLRPEESTGETVIATEVALREPLFVGLLGWLKGAENLVLVRAKTLSGPGFSWEEREAGNGIPNGDGERNELGEGVVEEEEFKEKEGEGEGDRAEEEERGEGEGEREGDSEGEGIEGEVGDKEGEGREKDVGEGGEREAGTG